MALSIRGPQARGWRIAVIDGPNMSNLGRRDQTIYGPIRSLADLQQFVTNFGSEIGVEVECYASNHEGEILEFIHGSAERTDGYIINPAGLTTYGEATRHALVDSGRPYVEVHFANIARHFRGVSGDAEPARSKFTYTATGLCMGLRQYSYVGGMLGLVLGLDDASFLGSGGAQTAGPSTHGH